MENRDTDSHDRGSYSGRATAGANGRQTEQSAAQPSPRRRRLHLALPLALAVLLGVLVGAGVFTLAYAEGLSYLSNDPEACVNCHIMREQYESWLKGPHHAVATCNDCHVAHALLSKYLAKAQNGWHHSSAFTLQGFEEPIRIKPRNAEALRQNCRRCHRELVADITGHYGSAEDGPDCVRCHRSVGHGRPGETLGVGP